MPTVTIKRVYELACSHQLFGLREGHKCMRPHGHNYKVELFVRSRVPKAIPVQPWPDLANGMVLEAGDLDVRVQPVLARLDHNPLNEVLKDGTPMGDVAAAQPTAENLALYLWERLGFLKNDARTHLVKVIVHENERLCAIVEE